MTTTEADGASEEARRKVAAYRNAIANCVRDGVEAMQSRPCLQGCDEKHRSLMFYIASLEARVEGLEGALETYFEDLDAWRKEYRRDPERATVPFAKKRLLLDGSEKVLRHALHEPQGE